MTQFVRERVLIEPRLFIEYLAVQDCHPWPDPGERGVSRRKVRSSQCLLPGYGIAGDSQRPIVGIREVPQFHLQNLELVPTSDVRRLFPEEDDPRVSVVLSAYSDWNPSRDQK